MNTALTIPLQTLALFVGWTLFVLTLLLWARTKHLSAGGPHSDFGKPDETKLIWRAYRAHYNCIENLPVYAGIILIISYRGLASPLLDVLAVTFIAARIGQSTVHLIGGNPQYRYRLLLVQIATMTAMLALATIL